MTVDYLVSMSNPALRGHLRKANEERAAAFYAAWKGGVRLVGAAFGAIVKRVARAWRAHATYRELAALSDHQLRDIGLFRGELAGIAETVAAEPPGTSVTIADLRGREAGRSIVSADDSLNGSDARRARNAGRPIDRPNAGHVSPQRNRAAA